MNVTFSVIKGLTRMKKALLFFLLLSFCAQSQTLTENENQLKELLDALRSAKTEQEMLQRNKVFTQAMQQFLTREGAFNYSLNQLKSVADLRSDDGLVRIVHWNLEFPDFSYTYSGFVARWDADEEKVYLTELVDVNDPYTPIPEGVLDAKNWYGALYYKMITVEYNGDYQYVLLGWDGGTSSSNFKLIDVLSFKGNAVKFGSPLFVNKKKVLKRVVFEYSDKSSMALQMDEKRNRIVFDHLSPENPSLNGVYSFYVPDFSYDAYVWVDDRFVLQEDVIAINDAPEEKNASIYVYDPKTGRPKKQSYQLKWINPENSDQPGDINHVARTPESEQLEIAEEKPEEVIPKKKWWDRRNPNKLSVTTGKYKRNRRRPPTP
ncbi:MAG: hypothetical protein EBR54_04035 [Flavobacteriia bacterium]|nr:hypothetical protein [Flavobacteriia bacterium]NBX38569.1 hypothetical protein [Flavobacteriia bacterium]